MPLTERLYQKSNSTINVAPTPPNTPSITLSVSPTPSLAYNYLFNVYNCLDGNCNQFLSQKIGFSYGTSLTLGYYYSSGSSAVQPVGVSGGTPVFNLDDTTGYANCASICNPPSVTPSISVSVSLTPSISISPTPSISLSRTPTPTPSPSV